jgi:hypothetical protein
MMSRSLGAGILLLAFASIIFIGLPQVVQPAHAATPALDGSNINTGTTSPLTVTLSTSSLNDFIIVEVVTYVVGVPPTVTGVTDSASHVTWQVSAREAFNSCTDLELTEWYGVEKPGDTLSTDTISVALTGAATGATVIAFGVSGATGFDPHAGLTYSASDSPCSSSTVPTVSSVSTTYPSDFVFDFTANFFGTAQASGTIGGQASTQIQGSTNVDTYSEYYMTSSPLSSSSCAFVSATEDWGIFCDALTNDVTQPITVTMANSAPAATLTISGATCTSNSTTFQSDGAVHHFAMVSGCSFTLGFSNSGTIRDGFDVSSAFSATSSAQTASSTPISLTAYQQDDVPASYSITGGGTSYTAPTLTYVSVGMAGQTATLTTTATLTWMDYETSWSSTNPLTGSSGSERWDSMSASGTVTGAAIAVSYYNQYSGTLDYAISGGGSPTAPSTIFTTFGGVTTFSLTMSPTAYWIDGGAGWSVSPNPLTGSNSTVRWETPTSTTSGTASGAFMKVFTYFHQSSQEASYSLNDGGSFFAPTLTATQFGVSMPPVVLLLTPQQVWIDEGSTWSATNALYNSTASDRGYSQSASGTVGKTGTIAPVYWHQVYVQISYVTTDSTAVNHPTFTIFQFGATQMETNSKIPTPYWVDYNSLWTAENPWVTTPGIQTQYATPVQGQAGSSAIIMSYTTASGCPSNPASALEQNCIIPAIVNAWSAPIGPQPWFALILLGVNVAIYRQTGSIWLTMMCLMLAGGVFNYMLPTLAGGIANTLTLLAAAGIGVKAVLRIS